MFELGVCDFDPDLLEDYKELNIKWAKFGKMYGESPQSIHEQAEALMDVGIQPIFDLRTNRDELTLPSELMTAFISNPEKAVDWAKIRESGLGIDQPFVDWCIDVIASCYPACSLFEIWGEVQCPILTGGLLPADRYVDWLGAIKVGIPQGVKITNGGIGLGPWKEIELQQFDDVHGFEIVDAFNLHPFTFQGDAVVQGKFYDWMLSAVAAIACRRNRSGLQVLFTEWGYPSGIRAGTGMLLQSGVLPMRIPPIDEDLQARIIDRSLRVFHKWNVGPICLITRDQDVAAAPAFWGYHSGIYNCDKTKKKAWNVVRRWGRNSAAAIRGDC